ncbi:MAG: DoxX family protein [Gemmatimonadetes bacterium]|nr:MAG: DoxX family protein [Gemmatimonadota bacterium]
MNLRDVVNDDWVRGQAWALLFARLSLGLMFFMPGWAKVFGMGPVEHARRFFIDGYADSFLPVWSLWAVGTAIPFVELVSGALLLLGVWRRPALLAQAAVLVTVTFGHLLADPFFDLTTHVLPRAALVIFLLWVPQDEDWWTVPALVERLRDRP